MMATPLLRNKLASEGSYTPDGTSDARSTTSDYVDSIEDGDLSDYGHHHATPASRPSTTRSILRALGVTAWRRKSGYHDYEPAGGKYDDGPMRAPRRSPQRDIRRCRISYVMGWVKRGLLAAPFLILMFLYVLSLRSRSFAVSRRVALTVLQWCATYTTRCARPRANILGR